MKRSANPPGESGDHPDAGAPSAEEKRFLAELLDALARQDPAAHDALLNADPALLDHYADVERLAERIRGALARAGARPHVPAQTPVIERTRGIRSERAAEAGPDGSASDPHESIGILTSVTRQVAPERAAELYRKITPVFVYQVLNLLNQSTPLRTVRDVVEHLCSEPVQARLRACPHVRDGILDELSTVLERDDIRRGLSRADLERVLRESGATQDLMAMENCLKLAASRAG